MLHTSDGLLKTAVVVQTAKTDDEQIRPIWICNKTMFFWQAPCRFITSWSANNGQKGMPKAITVT